MSNSDKVLLSVIVPVKNEADNLPRCLSSFSWADEIFVVDSHSQDATAAIAESMGAKVVQFDYKPPWPKKKNWALENLPFSHQWVLIMDADETLPPSAEAEIRRIVTEQPAAGSPVGYWIGRRYMFMGKWLKHCYYPNWNLRLFKHKLGRFEKLTNVETLSGDNEVHEHVVIDGPTAHLTSEMDHYAFPTVDVFVEKHNRYSNWEARVALDKVQPDTAVKLQHGKLKLLRKLRELVRKLPCRPLMRFLYVYIYQRGFMDGIEGFYFARLHGFYEFLIVAKTHELRRSQRKNGERE